VTVDRRPGTVGLLLLCATIACASFGTLSPFGAFGPFGAFDAFTIASAAQTGELIERTLAIVGGQVITLTDVQTAIALRLIEPAGQNHSVDTATAKLVERTLVLREVQRYAPPEPTDEQVDERLAAVRNRFSSAAEFARVLDAGGFTAARLRGWVREDLRIASYLDQRFAAVGAPSDEEVSVYYTTHRQEFERLGLGFAAAATIIRDRLSAERRSELIADWVADLRRRTTVVELWKKR
jgi:hypothetical protein